MKKDYERIWLTSFTWVNEYDENEVSWCDERVDDADVEYVNVREYDALVSRIVELEAESECVCDNLTEIDVPWPAEATDGTVDA